MILLYFTSSGRQIDDEDDARDNAHGANCQVEFGCIPLAGFHQRPQPVGRLQYRIVFADNSKGEKLPNGGQESAEGE